MYQCFQHFLMSNDCLIEELTYYKNLTEITADCIINNSGAIKSRAQKIKLCGTFIETAHISDDNGTVREVVTSANFCRERLCPMCQRRKSLKTSSDVRKLVEHLNGRGWVHMVLTVKNCSASELNETITKLFRDSSFLITKTPEFKKAFRGALRCLEVTFNSETDTYHPHLHVLLSSDKSYNNNSRKRISRDRLRWLWWEVSGIDYMPQVHIDSNVNEGIIAEIAKYCVKPLELDLPSSKRCEVLETLHSALQGRRLMQTYGEIKTAFKALKIDINSDSDREYVADTEQMFVYDFELSQYWKR